MENDDIRMEPETEAPVPPADAGAPAPEPAGAPGAESPAEGGAPAADDGGAAALRDLWLRAEADLQNYRRRAQREIEESRRIAEEAVMLEIIAAIDDLERALESVPPEAGDGWAAGVRLVAQRLREYLARNGVVAVEPVGEPFDPTLHEALLELPAPAGTTPGTVLQVALKGYRRGPRALRAARVVVARAAEG